MSQFHYNAFKDEYVKAMADHISVSVEDLSITEANIIDKGYEMFISKVNDIKTLEDEVRRLSIELANLKAMTENAIDEAMDGGSYPTCGRDESFRNDF